MADESEIDHEIYRLKLLKIKQLERELSEREGLPHLYGWPWYKWAWEIYNSNKSEILFTAANQISKAQCVRTEIPTPNGFKFLEDINIGDFVFDRQGQPVEVIDIPYLGEDECYEIEFNDFSKTTASGNHKWISKGYRERFRKIYSNRNGTIKTNQEYGKWNIYSTAGIISAGKYDPGTKPDKRFSIPISEKCVYENKNLFDPYYVGVYIGNGGESSITFNGEDLDVADRCLKYGRKYNTKKLVIGILKETKFILKSLGLNKRSFDKKIPGEYLLSSIGDRIKLLNGLMDTDGTCNKRGTNYSYSTTSFVLANQVLELVCSLGGIGQIKQYPSSYTKENGEKIKCRDHYIVTFWTTFNPFYSKRKSARWKLSKKYKHERVITKISPIGRRKMKCITVDNSDGSYLCTRNYIVTHNSSTMIRKNIMLATSPERWREFWPDLRAGNAPNLFWYFYPTLGTCTTEFEAKWQKEFLPRKDFKNDKKYGWKEEFFKGEIYGINFNSGVQIQFKSYEMKVKNLQSSSIYMLTADEEMPIDLYDELKSRLNATSGHFISGFTATLGQIFWEQAIEPQWIGKPEEKLPNALKMQIGLYDCKKYMDGTDSPWTEEKISRAISNCSSDSEIQRRIYGRFVKSEGLLYPSFSLEKNYVSSGALPKDWMIYGAIDPGSGDKGAHPTGIIFLAVNQEFTRGRVFRGWRGDGILTTSQDILNKFRELRQGYTVSYQIYDYAAKDFFMVASSQGETFIRADKAREKGIAILNTLFKAGMLTIDKDDPELGKLVTELLNLAAKTDKRDAADDLCDPLRYICAMVPWDFSSIEVPPELRENVSIPKPKTGAEQRRDFHNGKGEFQSSDKNEVDEELTYWSDLY